jgi:hypothetical protein
MLVQWKLYLALTDIWTLFRNSMCKKPLYCVPLFTLSFFFENLFVIWHFVEYWNLSIAPRPYYNTLFMYEEFTYNLKIKSASFRNIRLATWIFTIKYRFFGCSPLMSISHLLKTNHWHSFNLMCWHTNIFKFNAFLYSPR